MMAGLVLATHNLDSGSGRDLREEMRKLPPHLNPLPSREGGNLETNQCHSERSKESQRFFVVLIHWDSSRV